LNFGERQIVIVPTKENWKTNISYRNTLLKVLCKCYIPIPLVLKVPITVKYGKVSNSRTMAVSWLQQVFEAASVHLNHSAARHSQEHTLKFKLRPLLQLLEILPRDLQ